MLGERLPNEKIIILNVRICTLNESVESKFCVRGFVANPAVGQLLKGQLVENKEKKIGAKSRSD